MRNFRTASLVMGSLLFAACSADGEMFFGAPYANVNVGGTSTVVDSSSASSGGFGGDGGASNTSSVMVSVSTSNATSVTVGSVAVVSAVSSTVASSSSAVSSSVVTAVASSSTGMPVQNTIDCGSGLTCNLDKGEACCWDNLNLLDGPQNKCVTGPLDNDGCNTLQSGFGPETRIDCQDESDCGATKICCARRKQFFANGKQYSVYDQVRCEDSCNYQFNDQKFVVCIPNVTMCPMVPNGNKWVQSVCKASQLLPGGYYVCGVP